jgi:hypothetical protein
MDAALDEALQPRVPTWRPIETAPRDGTKVLMRVKGGGDDIILAKWDGIHWRLGQTSYDRTMLTHWCPLPVMP